MMIGDFSKGYYYTSMDVQTYDDGPVIARDMYDFINRELYAGTHAPIIMRVGLDRGPLFGVGSEGAMPSDVLALPPYMMTEEGEASVYIMKPEISERLSGFHG